MPSHPSAFVDPQAGIDPSVEIGAFAVVEGGVTLGPACRIGHSAVILGRTSLGRGCRVHAHAVIGDIPQDHAFDPAAESSCRIGEECIIREGATVHRGTADGSETVIGNRCFLMTNSHVGHNCILADDVILISGALLGGYVEIGPRAVISGNAAVHQFTRIGELAMISGLGKIVQDVPPFFMTDRDGAIVGVNTVGMRRAGMSAEERQEIKHAYRLIYRSGLSHQQALAELTDNVHTDAGGRLLRFLRADSKRGLASASTRKHR